MKKRLQIVAFILMLPFSVFAETILVEKATTGYGENYQDALVFALLDAVRQVRGLEVYSEKQLKVELQHLVKKGVRSIIVALTLTPKTPLSAKQAKL